MTGIIRGLTLSREHNLIFSSCGIVFVTTTASISVASILLKAGPDKIPCVKIANTCLEPASFNLKININHTIPLNFTLTLTLHIYMHLLTYIVKIWQGMKYLRYGSRFIDAVNTCPWTYSSFTKRVHNLELRSHLLQYYIWKLLCTRILKTGTHAKHLLSLFCIY